MAAKWGSPEVSRLQRQADTSMSYVANGTVMETIQHVGMVRALDIRYNATYGYTKSVGGSTKDAQGPFNAVTNLTLTMNSGMQVLNASAWMLYLFDLVHYGRRGASWDPASNANASVLQAATATDIFNFPGVPGASGNISNVLWTLRYPFTVELAGVREIGLTVLQNDEVNLAIQPTFNAVAASATALAAPYDIAGGDTFTLGTPTIDVLREFYAVPQDKASYPTIGWFHSVQSQRISMTSTQTDIPISKGGVVLRVIYQCVDGGTALMADANISNLQLLFGSNTTHYDEKLKDVLYRQRRSYGHELPQGVLVHDFWGDGEQTFKHTFDTMRYQNLRGRINTPNTPTAGSYVDVIVEKLIPISGIAEPLYEGQRF